MPDDLRVRGFPLLQLVIVAIAFALAGVPVWSLTRPAVDVAAAAIPPPKSQEASPAAASLPALTVETSFAPAPTSFQVQCEGQTVLEGHGPARQFSTHWQTALPKEGADLILRATWPAEAAASAGPAAARIKVRLPDGSEVEKSFWTAPGQSLAEIVTVP